MEKKEIGSFGKLVLISVFVLMFWLNACHGQPSVKSETHSGSLRGASDQADVDMFDDDVIVDVDDDDVIDNDTETVSVDGLKGILDKIAALDIDAADSTRQLVKTDFEIKRWVKNHYAELAHQEDAVSPVYSQLKSYSDALSNSEKSAFVLNCYALNVVDNDIYETFYMEGLQSYKEKFKVNTQGYTEDDVSLCNLFLWDIRDVVGEPEVIPTPASVVNGSASFNKEALYDVMTDITNIGWGSAGCSLRAAENAGELMNFTADIAECSKKEIAAGVKECYAALTPVDRYLFDVNFTSVLSIVKQLEKDPESVGELQSVEMTIDDSHYSAKKRGEWVSALSDLSGITY